jgi:DNA-binding IclR family transcriptional regulator
MPAAKAHRYLVSFMRVGLVAQDAVSGRYDLGTFALDLGIASLSRLDAVRVATPILNDLSEEIGETVALSVWGNMGPTFVRWIESRRPVSVNLRTGDVMPLLHSATGLCFAVFLNTPTMRDRIIKEMEIAVKGNDARPPRDNAEFEAIAAETRVHGLSRTSGTVIPNVNAFAAPVFDRDGKMALAITTLGPAGLFNSHWNGPIAKAVMKAAQTASRRLGWREAGQD